MGRGPRGRLPRAGTVCDGHGAAPAASRAGERFAAVERSIHGAAAGSRPGGLPRAAAARLRAVLRSLCRVRDVVVARVSSGVLAPVVSASGGVRLDDLRRALGRLASAAHRAPGLPRPGRSPDRAQQPAAAGDPEPYAGAALRPKPWPALHPEPYCPGAPDRRLLAPSPAVLGSACRAG